jgi:hypothetical protein
MGTNHGVTMRYVGAASVPALYGCACILIYSFNDRAGTYGVPAVDCMLTWAGKQSAWAWNFVGPQSLSS